MRFQKLGLTEHDPKRATPGFTLFTPLVQRATYLLNMAGEVVHSWDLPAQAGNYTQLLPNGNLFAATYTDAGPKWFNAKGGLMQEIDWDGNVVWEYTDDNQHHDFRRLENGNTIYLAWELMPKEAAAKVTSGRPGTDRKDGIWCDYIREVNPAGETVWEWHAHEHMDPETFPLPPTAPRAEFAHANTLAPTPDGNVIVSWRHNDLCAVVDRETGAFKWSRQNHGWGGQHDVQILDNGHVMLFANGGNYAGGRFSRVLEMDMESDEVVWSYQGTPRYTFYSPHISGAQRFANGNTLICEGQWGRIFEVTSAGDIVWEYVSPYFVTGEAKPEDADSNCVFRAYRYAADGPEIQGRLGA